MDVAARAVVAMGTLALLMPVPALVGWDYPLLLPYAWHKVLHLAGALLFLGNVATGALWGSVAVATRKPATVAFTLRVVNWSDAVFTGPGVLLVMANGLAMAGALGGVRAHAFTWWGLWILWAVTATWLLVLVPDQHRIRRKADDAARTGDAFPEGYWPAVLRWSIVGGLAGAAAFAVLVLMVLKP